MSAINRSAVVGLIAFASLAFNVAAASAATEGLAFKSSWKVEDPNAVGHSEFQALDMDQLSHDLYIGEEGREVTGAFIEATGVFDNEGEYQRRIDYRDSGTAFDEATGEILVANDGDVVIDVLDSAGILKAEWNGSVTPSGSFGQGTIFAAVDNSNGPSKSDVYVSDSEDKVVDLLTASGSPTNFTGSAGYISGSQLTGTPKGPFNAPRSVAVDKANGDIYVDDDGETVDVFAPTGEYLFSLRGVAFGGVLDIEVDGATGAVYAVDYVNKVLDVFDASGAFEYQVTGTASGPFRSLSSVAVEESTQDVYLLEQEAEAVDVFQPGPLPPAPNTDSATAVTSTSATLHGDVHLEGSSVGYYFTYAKGTSCVGTRTTAGSTGPGTGDAHAEAAIAGLEPATVYSFCFYTATGQTARPASALTFETLATPPAVDDRPLAATSVTPTEELLSGVVNPNNKDTTYYFEYGTTAAYGSTSGPPPGVDIGSGFEEHPVSSTLTGLQPSTVYHYRLVAVNAAGEAFSSPDETFTTLANPATAITLGASEVDFDAATVSGTVAPGSAGPASETEWCFEYGTVQNSGYNLGSIPLMPQDAGQGAAVVPVSVRLTGLAAGASYRYRLVAVNSLGLLRPGSQACGTEAAQESDGAEKTFTTPITALPPTVSTGAVSNVSQNAATLSGMVDSNGTTTSYAFQVGIDTNYGVQLFASAGSAVEAQPVSMSLEGLQPGTTYHYRLVAINQGGEVYGADATFTTPVFASAALSAPVAEPLVATPDIAFPRVVESANKPKSKKPSKSKKRRKAKPARKQKAKRASQKAKRASKGRTGPAAVGHARGGRKESGR